MNLFQRQSAKGQVGETLALNYLTSKEWKVEDVSKNENYFDKDIDFLVEKEGASTSIDVKTEDKMSETGNMFIEWGINYSNGKYKGGWAHYSKAEYIWHINPKTSTAFAYRLEDMKKYLRTAPEKWGTCQDGYKSVDGRLVKPEEYKQSGFWWQEMNLREIF